MKFLVFTCLFIAIQLLFLNTAVAQQFEGVVMDSASNTPLPYVNIGIVGKDVGTVSDSSGHFKIFLDSKYNLDTLRVSLVGYAKKSFVVGDFKKSNQQVPVSIELKAQAILLSEVVVLSANSLPIILGNKPKSKMVNAGFVYNKLGHEIGSVFRNKNNPLTIDSVRLNFVKCSYDRVYLRLNVYTMDGDEIENIFPKPYYISLTRDQILKNPTFDLSDYALMVKGDFLVSVELIKDLGERGLYFYAILKDDTSPGIYRETSQSNWIYMKHKSQPFGISIQAFAH
jgi:hypothetical protein